METQLKAQEELIFIWEYSRGKRNFLGSGDWLTKSFYDAP